MDRWMDVTDFLYCTG